MKFKNLIAILLALAMILSLCACNSNNVIDEPTGSENNGETSSTEGETKDDDIKIEDCDEVHPGTIDLSQYDKHIKLKDDGEYTFSGELVDKMIYVNADNDVTLIFNSVKIENSDGPCVYIRDSEMATIVFEGENVMKVSGNSTYEALEAAIYSKADLTLQGSGSVEIETTIGHAIKGKDSVIVESGSYNIKSFQDCINANDDLIINGGTLNLSSTNDEGLQSDTNLTINDGIITLNTVGDAIRAEVLLTVNGGEIKVESASEGLESKDEIVSNGGRLILTTTNDCINAINKFTMNDGTIYAESSTNDAIDSNGTMVFNGGYVYAVGTKAPEGAIDCDNRGLQVNGGVIIGLGTANTTKHDGEQNILLIGAPSDEIVEKIEIKDENGNIVFECDIEDYSAAGSGGMQDQMSAGGGQNGQAPGVGGMPDMSDIPAGEIPEMNGDFEGMTPPDGFVPDTTLPDGQMPDFTNPGDVSGDGESDSQKRPNGQRPSGEVGNSSDKDNFKDEGNRGDWNVGGVGGGMMSNSLSFFITCPELVNGTYYVYINGELLDTVTVSSNATTVGQVSSMGF